MIHLLITLNLFIGSQITFNKNAIISIQEIKCEKYVSGHWTPFSSAVYEKVDCTKVYLNSGTSFLVKESLKEIKAKL